MVVFKTFHEAAAYAKRCAKEIDSSVKLMRHGDEWAVLDPREHTSTTVDVTSTEERPSHFFTPDWDSEKRRFENAMEAKRKADYEEKTRKHAQISRMESETDESWKQHSPCYICGGQGMNQGRRCTTCKGWGYIKS